MTWLNRLAAKAPVPVYPAIGPDCLPAVEALLRRPGLLRVDTPRHAGVLLVAGDIPEAARAGLDRVHDQVPQPRASFVWDGTGDPLPRLREVWQSLWADEVAGAPDRLPDQPPNEWKGKGDRGTGGKGMMGGVPYGRPMAMPDDDIRDGLQLDAYTARVGPFASMWPPGFKAEITLQGDVIVDFAPKAAPFAQPDTADAPGLRAARMLRLLGLPLQADRAAEGKALRALWAVGAVPKGLGALDGAGDARTRLRAALAGESGPDAAPGLRESLLGLEWSEAALVLASLPLAVLRAELHPEGGSE
jgi:hypothetical protein